MSIATNAALQFQLQLHDQVARSLRQVRQQRGALNVTISQARPVFDKGELVDLRADHRNRAKDLIVGDALTVELMHVDIAQRFIDFQAVSG